MTGPHLGRAKVCAARIGLLQRTPLAFCGQLRHFSVMYSSPSPESGNVPKNWLLGLRRGLAQRCPSCGNGALFLRYLKINRRCVNCGLELGEFRADDAPPYFTILLVGHLIIPAMLLLEQLHHPPEWLHAALWIPLTLLLTAILLPRIKGAVIGVLWANHIRG